MKIKFSQKLFIAAAITICSVNYSSAQNTDDEFAKQEVKDGYFYALIKISDTETKENVRKVMKAVTENFDVEHFFSPDAPAKYFRLKSKSKITPKELNTVLIPIGHKVLQESIRTK